VKNPSEPNDASGLNGAGAVADTQDLLDLAQEAGHLGLFEWQVQAGTLRLSPKFLSLYGLTDFDGRYDAWLKCIFREDVPRIVDLFDNAFEERARRSEAVPARPPCGHRAAETVEDATGAGRVRP